MYKTPIVIAEMCGNHCGKIEIARKMIEIAARSGAQIAKFQKRCVKELLSEEQYNAPHPNPVHAYGKTYGEHREALEFDIQTHQQFAEYCKSLNIEYSTSVWDMTSAKEVIETINPLRIKIPSACNNHENLLVYLRDVYQGEIHVSLGMTVSEEEQRLLEIFQNHEDRLVIYACTSGYPVPFEKVYLLEVKRLTEQYGNKIRIGFSGHHKGIAVDVAAYTLGAEFIERHFSLDRSLPGTDQAASLEEPGLQKLCRDLKACHAALNYKPQEMDEIELVQRKKLKFKL